MPTVTVGQENPADIEIHYSTMAPASPPSAATTTPSPPTSPGRMPTRSTPPCWGSSTA